MNRGKNIGRKKELERTEGKKKGLKEENETEEDERRKELGAQDFLVSSPCHWTIFFCRLFLFYFIFCIIPWKSLIYDQFFLA